MVRVMNQLSFRVRRGEVFDSLHAGTCCIYPATRNLSDNPDLSLHNIEKR